MNKIRVLSIAVVLLILLNIGLIVVISLNKPPHPNHPKGNLGPKNIIIERLHFDATQVVAYENLIIQHQETIQSKEDQLRTAKEKLYTLLAVDNQTEKVVLIDKINSIQKEIEEIHFNHFLDIKKLCKENQLKDYTELTNELARLFSPHPMPKR